MTEKPQVSEGSNVATIRTERVTLAPVWSHHVDALHAHWTEPGVSRYLWDGEVISREQVREMIAKSREMFDRLGTGLWWIGLREDGSFVGCAGFWHFHEPPEQELIYSLSERYWGRGLARESAEGLIAHAFGALDWSAVQASADTPNEASLRVMRALGMRPVGTRPGAFGTIDVFRLTREEWRARAGLL